MNDFLDRVPPAPDQTNDDVGEVTAPRRTSLINQLMMGSHAWMQLANQTVPGLTPEQNQDLYRERAKRAAEYRESAELAREILKGGGVDKYNLLGLQCAVLDLMGSPCTCFHSVTRHGPDGCKGLMPNGPCRCPHRPPLKEFKCPRSL